MSLGSVLMLKVSLTCVSRVDVHRFEAVVRHQGRASPFPNTSHFTLTSQMVPIGCDRNGVPVIKANIATSEITENSLIGRVGLAEPIDSIPIL